MDSATTRLTTKIASTSLALLFMTIYVPAQTYPYGHEYDNSDWWSTYTSTDEATEIKAQNRLPASSDYRILGITLGGNRSRNFRDVVAKLGKATIAMRGDASTGRDQICYMSAGGSKKVHLIFEQGELDDSFYLFAGGLDWTGSDRCVVSSLVTPHLATASGIHLGQSPFGVEAILGKPSIASKNKIVYSFVVKRRMNPEEIQKIRKQRPDARDEDFTYHISLSIEARFDHSKLSYLVVSRSDTE